MCSNSLKNQESGRLAPGAALAPLSNSVGMLAQGAAHLWQGVVRQCRERFSGVSGPLDQGVGLTLYRGSVTPSRSHKVLTILQGKTRHEFSDWVLNGVDKG